MVVIGALVVLVLGGACLLVLAVRGRRIDDHPLCRRCGFDLSGIERGQAARCPECGCSLGVRHAVRIGNRRRRPWQVIGASMLMVIMLGVVSTAIWASATSFDWNSVKPAWLLVRESKAYGPGGATALDEIRRRIARKDIDQAAVSQVVDLMLARQADDDLVWNITWGDLVEEAHEHGLVSEAQWATYGLQAIQVRIAYRERVQAGLTLPFKMDLVMRCGSRGPRTNAMVRVGPAAGEGIDASHPPSRCRTGLMNNGRASTWTHHLHLDGADVGLVKLSIPYRVEIFDLASRGGASLGVIERNYETTIEVVDPAEAVVRLIDPDEQRRAQFESIGIRMKRSPTTSLVDLVLDTSGVTVPIGAHVILRRNGIDKDIGSITIPGDVDGHAALLGGPAEPGTYDVILRPDPEAAHGMVGLDRIWGEEIVIRNVLLK